MTDMLSEPQNKALQELKKLIHQAIDNHQLPSFEGKVTIWSVSILGDEMSDNVLLKFLRSRGFKAMDAFAMIKNALCWHNEVGVESFLSEDLGNDYAKMLVTQGCDKEGYPVWYLVLEECFRESMRQSMFSDGEEQRKFLRWLMQCMEKKARKLDFNSFILVIDLKSFTWYENRNIYKVIHKFLQLLDDNYPEFVARKIWVNASLWYRSYCRVYSIVVDGWTSNRVVFSGTSKTTETLFKYICPGQVPVKYGGLSRDDEQEWSLFTAKEPVSEVTIEPRREHSAEFNFAEACVVAWELRVIGWDVGYEATFVPSMKGRYMTNITKPRKLTPNHEPVIFHSFRVPEPGKLILTIHNVSSYNKKKFLCRIRVMGSEHDLGEAEAPSLRGWLVPSHG